VHPRKLQELFGVLGGQPGAAAAAVSASAAAAVSTSAAVLQLHVFERCVMEQVSHMLQRCSR
jgi:hypothetical protein